MGDYQSSDYQSALDIFNQTVANLSMFADEQKAESIRELQAYQAQSGDTDMGAYNLTMYGFDQVSSIKENVVTTVGNASNYFINDSTPVMAVQTDHTSISSSIAGHDLGLLSPLINDPASLLPTHDTGTMMVWIAFSLLFGSVILFTRR